jgi:hypothetical protein
MVALDVAAVGAGGIAVHDLPMSAADGPSGAWIGVVSHGVNPNSRHAVM